jgi:hypothetical protein
MEMKLEKEPKVKIIALFTDFKVRTWPILTSYGRFQNNPFYHRKNFSGVRL